MSAGYVYIMTNQRRGMLYIGATSDLVRRVHEHREGLVAGQDRPKTLKHLVYVEVYDDLTLAQWRENTIRQWPRRWKIATIEAFNPEWQDMLGDVVSGHDGLDLVQA